MPQQARCHPGEDVNESRLTPLDPLKHRKPVHPYPYLETFYEDRLVEVVVILGPQLEIHVRVRLPMVHESANAITRSSMDEDLTTFEFVIE